LVAEKECNEKRKEQFVRNWLQTKKQAHPWWSVAVREQPRTTI